MIGLSAADSCGSKNHANELIYRAACIIHEVRCVLRMELLSTSTSDRTEVGRWLW